MSDEANKLKCLAIMITIIFGGNRGKFANPTVKFGRGGIMSSGGLAGGWTGAVRKVDGIMRQKQYEEILRKHLLTSNIKLKLWHK